MNKTWITQGRLTLLATVEIADEGPLAHPSDGESKVVLSNEALPSPWQVVPKVVQSDKVEHTLNKGAWAMTPTKHCGWQIFIEVSYP